MYWPAVFVLAVAAATPTRAVAQEQAGAAKAAAAVDAAVGTGVADRALAGAAESFSASVGKLYCFSKIENAADSDIEHVWYKDSTEVGRVKLHVGGSPWRTHSSKNLGENAAGNWRCDVVQDGKVLKSVAFKVE
ncbi:MAG: DUF2914 domain-containing protein [Betaproteobacteria bacterium]|nr:MAG: DUF2914 domain-containing protein [Betaproteobacteria bacterium]